MVEADSVPAVLITLHPYNRTVPVNVHPLLQIWCGCAGAHFQPAGQRLARNDLGMRLPRLEDRRVSVDPELDSVHVCIPGVLSDALDPVDDLPSQSLAAERLIETRIQ